ncbi:MAG: glycosyltransferase family 39 protein [Cyclobacteriaceae bacterium]|nr:glycosyltransferase family 39 protein [Cyclobacteriaceae bacterium]
MSTVANTAALRLERITAWAVGLVSTLYMIGWSIDIMDVDAGQYAAMTREMLERGNFLEFTDRGGEYLDKPPLLFWVSGLSMSLFGINEIAYRIPAFLASLLAFYSTYRLARFYYDKQTGLLAAAILATTQALFLINHDVRTDTNLLCWYAFSLWQLAAYLTSKKTLHFILAFVGIGMAMLAKGPIGIIAPAMGTFMHLALTKDWKTLFHPKWLVGVIIVLVVLLPMMYGLYHQFDLHPEKTVNGLQGVSGLRFFFWTQSFGRITGESIWENDAGPFFLTHSTLWAFAPWSLLLILGLWAEIKEVVLHIMGKARKKEFLILFGFLLPFIALSSSRYQLPHYAFIVYPLGAIITAKFVLNKMILPIGSFYRTVYWVHIVLMIITVLVVLTTVTIAFPQDGILTISIFMVALAALGFILFSRSSQPRLILFTIATALFINLALNTVFYPRLLEHQAGSALAKKAVESGLTSHSLYSYQAELPYSMDFYSNGFVIYEGDFDKIIQQKNIWVFLKETDLGDFKARRPDLTVIATVGDYPVTQLSLEFINPATREKTLQRRCLIKL